ncbi:MAG: hypothetical protein J6L88_07995 [Clostridia bacterium]|nr:hypothetical protein [Clostridia bacterium]
MFIAVCFSFYFIKAVPTLLCIKKQMIGWLARHLVLVSFVQLLVSFAAFALCRMFGAAVLLLAVLTVPASVMICHALFEIAQRHKVDPCVHKAARRVRRCRNLICIAVTGGEKAVAFIHIFKQVLDQKTIFVQNADLLALAETLNKDLDSTVRFVVFPLAEGDPVQNRKMLRMTRPRITVLCGDNREENSSICPWIKNGGAVVTAYAALKTLQPYIRQDVLVRTYSLEKEPQSTVEFYDFVFSANGTSCIARERTTQSKIVCTMQLLGQDALCAAAAAAACARLVGISLDDVVQHLQQAGAQKGQLSLTQLWSGSVYIDDTKVATLADFQRDLEILDDIPGRKIAILGSFKNSLTDSLQKNKALGHIAAEHVQIVLLCGEGAQAVQCGLLERGFPVESILFIQSAAHLRRSVDALATHNDIVIEAFTKSYHYLEVL